MRRVRPLAALVAAAGVVAIAAAVLPGDILDRLAGLFLPAVVTDAGVIPLALAGGILLYLANGVERQRRRAGAVIAVGALAQTGWSVVLGASNDWADGPVDQLRVALSLLTLVLLALAARALTVVGAPLRSVRLGGGLAALVLVTVALSAELAFSGPGSNVLAGGPAVVVALLVALGGLLLLFATEGIPPTTAADRHRARAIIDRYGTDTLANFARRDDRRYFIGSDGEAVIPFAERGRFVLAPGGPIGHPGSIDAVIDELVQQCQARGLGFAFLSVPEDDLDRYARRGLRHFYFGSEAVVACDQFSLAGKRNKSLRQSAQRVARDHRFVNVAERDADPALITALQALSLRWRGGQPERGFSMATSSDVGASPPDAELCVAIDGRGRPTGFLRVFPTPADPDTYTLDLSRRDADGPNGVSEFLVSETVLALRERGVHFLSLNFAVMGRLYHPDRDLSVGDRALKAFFAAFNPFFPFRSLYDFTRRFRPEWIDRVLVYEHHRALPLLAVLYFGLEGYLSFPVIGRWFDPAWRLPVEPEVDADAAATVIDLRDPVTTSAEGPVEGSAEGPSDRSLVPAEGTARR